MTDAAVGLIVDLIEQKEKDKQPSPSGMVGLVFHHPQGAVPEADRLPVPSLGGMTRPQFTEALAEYARHSSDSAAQFYAAKTQIEGNAALNELAYSGNPLVQRVLIHYQSHYPYRRAREP